MSLSSLYVSRNIATKLMCLGGLVFLTVLGMAMAALHYADTTTRSAERVYKEGLLRLQHAAQARAADRTTSPDRGERACRARSCRAGQRPAGAGSHRRSDQWFAGRACARPRREPRRRQIAECRIQADERAGPQYAASGGELRTGHGRGECAGVYRAGDSMSASRYPTTVSCGSTGRSRKSPVSWQHRKR